MMQMKLARVYGSFRRSLIHLSEYTCLKAVVDPCRNFSFLYRNFILVLISVELSRLKAFNFNLFLML